MCFESCDGDNGDDYNAHICNCLRLLVRREGEQVLRPPLRRCFTTQPRLLPALFVVVVVLSRITLKPISPVNMPAASLINLASLEILLFCEPLDTPAARLSHGDAVKVNINSANCKSVLSSLIALFPLLVFPSLFRTFNSDPPSHEAGSSPHPRLSDRVLYVPSFLSQE